MLIFRSLMPTDDSARVTSPWSAFDAICRSTEGTKRDNKSHQCVRRYFSNHEKVVTSRVGEVLRSRYYGRRNGVNKGVEH